MLYQLRLFACVLAICASATAAAADAVSGAGPNPCLHPIATTHTFPPYPILSQQLGEQGTTTLKVVIDPDGSANSAVTYRSSGSLRLDDAAAAYVKETWRWAAWTPDCAAGAITTLISVAWHLNAVPAQNTPYILVTMDVSDYPPDALAKQEQGAVLATLLLSETGTITGVHLQTSSGFSDLDNKALDIAKTRWKWAPAQMSGRPVKTVIALAMQWKLPAPKGN